MKRDSDPKPKGRLLHLAPRAVSSRTAPSKGLLIPTAGDCIVQRVRLIDQIKPAVGASRVRLLIAPAGCGKTSTLIQLARIAESARLRVAWLDLSPVHARPDEFRSLLEEAIGGDDASPCAVEPDAAKWAHTTVSRLLKVLRSSSPSVLCIDNVEELRDRSAQLLLEQLITRWPVGHTLYCAGRTLHAVRLGRMLLDGTAVETGSKELAFDRQELNELARQLDVPPDVVSSSESASFLADGWVAGARAILLASRARRRGLDAMPTMLERYLEDQVCGSLESAQIDTLMDLATLDTFNVALLAELPGRPVTWNELQQLRDLGIEIQPCECDSARDHQEWYRLQPLVGRFLALRQRRTKSTRSLALHRFAADWLERNGYATEAVRHAALCHDEQYSTALMERAGAFRLSLSEGVSVLRLEGASEHLDVAKHPLVVLGQIYLKAQEGRVGEARAQFEHLRTETDSFHDWNNVNPVPEARRLADLIETALDFYEDRPFSAEAVEQLQHHLDASEGDPLVRGSIAALLALAYVGNGLFQEAGTVCEIGLATTRHLRAHHVAFYLRVQQAHAAIALGRFQEAVLYVERARELALAVSGGWSEALAISDVLRGVLHYEANELDEAEEHLARALPRQPLFTAWFEISALGFSAKVAIAGLRRGPERVVEVLSDVEALSRRNRMPRLADLAAVLRLREAVRAGNLPYAMDLLRGERLTRLTSEAQPDLEKWELRLRTLALVEGARLMTRLVRFKDGAVLLGRINKGYIYGGDATQRFTYQTLSASLSFHLGRYQDAFDTFGSAMGLALECGLTRRLLNNRDHLLEIFDRAVSTGRPLSSRTVTFCTSVLKHAGDSESRVALDRRLLPGNRPIRSPEVELSPREAEILSLIAEGLSTKEIAYRLSVSTSTVKTHRRKIYQKLGVGRRSQAIAQARAKSLV